MAEPADVAIIGASGYTGAELLRLLVGHPLARLRILTAERRAGAELCAVFPQFARYALPELTSTEAVDWAAAGVDFAFCALPHGTTQRVIHRLLKAAGHIKVVDLSADFRLRDTAAYKAWYGQDHLAAELQQEAIYGLVEIYREEIKAARLVASPGCYPTCALLPLIPLLRADAILADEIIIDAKSGTTGAGRAVREDMLFAEVAEGMRAYGIGRHRHMAELDQELAKAAGRPLTVSFTPHLVPMNRGLLSTIYVRARGQHSPEDLYAIVADAYAGERFVHVLPFGEVPQTRSVRGSNQLLIGLARDRSADRAILVAALDNLMKGASGQAVQAMNVMLGYPEGMGLEAAALAP